MAASAIQVAGSGTRNSISCTATVPVTGWSACFWVRADDAKAGNAYGTVAWAGSGAQDDAYFYLQGISFLFIDYPGASPGNTLTQATWYWVSIKDDGSANRTYQYSTTAGDAAPTTATVAHHIAADRTTLELGSDTSNDQAEISLCGVKFWNAQLTNAQLQAESTQVNPIITASLVAFNSGKYNDGRAESSMPAWTVHGTVTVVGTGPNIPDTVSSGSTSHGGLCLLGVG